VAGVAGLFISQGKDRNFNLTNNDVKHIIELTTVEAGPTLGFDNETGFGRVNAKNALQLLAPPNVLYHYTSTGGTSTKIATISPWIILDNRWGIAAGSYFNVDQYKMTKHVNFDIPFCALPKVWLRERECTSLDYARPNSGRPTAFITNVTATGFDLEYVTYFVKTSATGAAINQWVPAAPASSTVAYTAVGQPNPAALVGPISGASIICDSTMFIADNNPTNLPITWSSSNPSGLTINPSTGRATRINNFNGQVTITATVNSPCGSVNVNVPPLTISVGSEPSISFANTALRQALINNQSLVTLEYQNYIVQEGNRLPVEVTNSGGLATRAYWKNTRPASLPELTPRPGVKVRLDPKSLPVELYPFITHDIGGDGDVVLPSYKMADHFFVEEPDQSAIENILGSGTLYSQPLHINGEGLIEVTVTAANACGIATAKNNYIALPPSRSGNFRTPVSVAPNPADDYFTIDLQLPAPEQITIPCATGTIACTPTQVQMIERGRVEYNYLIEVFSFISGQLVATTNHQVIARDGRVPRLGSGGDGDDYSRGEGVVFNTVNIPDGLYILRIYSEREQASYSMLLVVRH
jgi:hypothetical protein